MTANTSRILRITFIILGLVVFYIAQKFTYLESLTKGLSGLGIILTIASMVVSLVAMNQAKRQGFVQEKKIHAFLLIVPQFFLIAMVSYLGFEASLGDKVEAESFLSKALLSLWVMSFFIGLTALIGFERGALASGVGAFADVNRVKRSGYSWISIGLLLCSLIGINYAGAKRDISKDLTYLKVTKPSDSTIGMLHSLDKPLNIYLFYEKDSEVLDHIDPFFNQVKKESQFIELKTIDRDLDPLTAKRLKVSSNGQVVFEYEERTERINVGSSEKRARRRLTKLDSMTQRSLAKLLTKPKVAYFTKGHYELSPQLSRTTPQRSMSKMQTILKWNNFNIKNLSIADGLGNEVPSDATLLIIAGARTAFSPQEIDSIKRFVNEGGSLLVMLDEDEEIEDEAAKTDLSSLVSLMSYFGLHYDGVLLADETRHMAFTRTDQDRYFTDTRNFGSHEATKSISANDQGLSVIYNKAGTITLEKINGYKPTGTIKSMNTTFRDSNSNAKKDGEEKSESHVIGAIAEGADGKEAERGRVMLLADATIFSDFLMISTGNQVAFNDAVRWLANEEIMAVSETGEEDIKIVHSKSKDNYIFYGSIFFVPSLVLLAGFVSTRFRRRRKEGGGRE